MILKPRGRNPLGMLFPLVRKTRPRRDAVSGETQKHHILYPPPWLNQHKDFNKPKNWPLEIDHINGWESDARPSNLRWLTKLNHIERTQQQLFPFRRKRRKGAPSRLTGRRASWE